MSRPGHHYTKENIMNNELTLEQILADEDSHNLLTEALGLDEVYPPVGAFIFDRPVCSDHLVQEIEDNYLVNGINGDYIDHQQLMIFDQSGYEILDWISDYSEIECDAICDGCYNEYEWVKGMSVADNLINNIKKARFVIGSHYFADGCGCESITPKCENEECSDEGTLLRQVWHSPYPDEEFECETCGFTRGHLDREELNAI